jgi:hypothetical protein
LTDQRGTLQVTAASTEQTRLLELFQLQVDEGPCLDCYRTGRPISALDLSVPADRWPKVASAAAAVDGGFAAVAALPIWLRDEVIGALNVFDTARDILTQQLGTGALGTGPGDRRRVGAASATARRTLIALTSVEPIFSAQGLLTRPVERTLCVRCPGEGVDLPAVLVGADGSIDNLGEQAVHVRVAAADAVGG